MSRNKKIGIILSAIVIIAISVFLYMKIEKTEEENGFVGEWVDILGDIDEIKRDSDNTFKLTIIDGEDGETSMVYTDGYITDDGYLVFEVENADRYIGYKVEDENTLSGWRFWKKEDGSRPEDCVIEESSDLTRNEED
jgi:hypothetical protein